MHKKNKVNANTFIASDTKGIQTGRESVCVCAVRYAKAVYTSQHKYTRVTLFENSLSLAQANGLYKYGLYTYHNISVAFFFEKVPSLSKNNLKTDCLQRLLNTHIKSNKNNCSYN